MGEIENEKNGKKRFNLERIKEFKVKVVKREEKIRLVKLDESRKERLS